MSGDVAAWVAAVREGVTQAVPRAGAFAQHVSVRTTTGSTNDDVVRAALDGAPEGYTVIAAEQTAGRGRRGASWHSPAAGGLYLSTLLRPDRWAAVRADAASPASSLVTLMAGVAVVSAIGDIGHVPVELKWPNDVMVRTPSPGPPWRKLAGILAEGGSDGGVVRTVVLGIGVNVHRSDAPADVAARMIALDDLLPERSAHAHTLAQSLVAALLVRLREGTALLAGGLLDEVRARWLRVAPSVQGTRVRWQAQGIGHEGDAAGIDAAGALRVRVPDGERTVHSGDVEWMLGTDIGAFCREVEAHLCRVNGGHLVRIVGPAFELVSGWATEGMPLRVVLHGVDRTVTRLTSKGPRRRPVRIEFCEADVRDAYDQWRRAVGVRAATPDTADATSVEAVDAPSPRLRSLPKHLERVLVRLSALGATRELAASFREALGTTIRDVDACLDAARGARGEARSAILDRLGAIELAMTEAALAALADTRRTELVAEVSRELSPYRGTMPPAAFHDAENALLGELVRRHFSLPQVRLDG